MNENDPIKEIKADLQRGGEKIEIEGIFVALLCIVITMLGGLIVYILYHK